jgi:23S rRNA (uracil1939-C5)-methyltransferase
VSEELKIEKLVYGGDGLSRVDGEVVFTPFVLPGETVETERSGSRKQAQRASLVRVLEPSAERVTPECPYFGRCGGCHYQHASREAQLRLKREILSETLRRVGKIEWSPDRITTVPCEPYGYRNRAQFHFENGRLGYREAHSRKLVAIDRCPISSPKINEIIVALNRMVRDRRWPRFLTSLEVFTDERQVQWNVLETERPIAKIFFEWLLEEVPGTVLGPLEYVVNGDVYTVSGPAFFQVNRLLLPDLAQIAIGEASGAAAWDLYAGVGLFSLPLARRFEKVTAVESGRAAASDLERNARRARLGIRTVQEPVEAFLTQAREAPDFVLLDPPRSGLEKSVTARLVALHPRELAIVACDPATLARDLAGLDGSYHIERITMIDLFPQTFHIEAVVKLVYATGSTIHEMM